MFIFVNGTFDIIHPGHIKLLKHAASYPDAYVAVYIDTDARVAKLKGPDRPVNTAKKRMEVLMAIRYVDDVGYFGSDAELSLLLQTIKPDVMVKGADYRNKPIIGAEYCGKIDFVELTDDSTTKIYKTISSGR